MLSEAKVAPLAKTAAGPDTPPIAKGATRRQNPLPLRQPRINQFSANTYHTLEFILKHEQSIQNNTKHRKTWKKLTNAGRKENIKFKFVSLYEHIFHFSKSLFHFISKIHFIFSPHSSKCYVFMWRV